MPELPEVETMCRGLACAVGGRIRAASFPRSRVRPLAITPAPATLGRRISGRTIAGVRRRGKRVVMELTASGRSTDTLWLAIEPRMTGLMLVTEAPSPEHVRLVLDLDHGRRGGNRPRRVLFWDRRGLGTITLHDRRGLEAACGTAKLGPDGLEISGADLVVRLGRSRRAVKPALLDQKAVAGIGNIYAAEILLAAGVDPRAACRRLDADAWERIATACRRLLALAVRLEGSTIGDETYRTADNRSGRFQRRHRAYGRAGLACRRCGTLIERIVQVQRSTFFCPRCQWRPHRRFRTL